jgi:hypothetical protein
MKKSSNEGMGFPFSANDLQDKAVGMKTLVQAVFARSYDMEYAIRPGATIL